MIVFDWKVFQPVAERFILKENIGDFFDLNIGPLDMKRQQILKPGVESVIRLLASMAQYPHSIVEFEKAKPQELLDFQKEMYSFYQELYQCLGDSRKT